MCCNYEHIFAGIMILSWTRENVQKPKRTDKPQSLIHLYKRFQMTSAVLNKQVMEVKVTTLDLK